MQNGVGSSWEGGQAELKTSRLVPQLDNLVGDNTESQRAVHVCILCIHSYLQNCVTCTPFKYNLASQPKQQSALHIAFGKLGQMAAAY